MTWRMDRRDGLESNKTEFRESKWPPVHYILTYFNLKGKSILTNQYENSGFKRQNFSSALGK